MFVGMIPAVKFSTFGVGGRSHLVRQRTAGGRYVIRRLHWQEVSRLFHTEAFDMQWGTGEEATARQGNAAPPAMIMPALQGIVRFFQVPHPEVPTTIEHVISNEHVRAFRGGMTMAMHDYVQTREPRTATEAVVGERRKRTKRKQRPKQPQGGIVFEHTSEVPMFLGTFWRTKDTDDIVPMAYVRHEGAVVRKEAFRALTQWYPDQEVIAALGGAGVPSKNFVKPGVAVLGTNHKASVEHFKFVDKMYQSEVAAGRMAMFGVTQSPPIWPLIVSPTGAVVKKLRDGSIDPDNMRPTADYSWPPPGFWMELLTKSPNASVDLQRDFPYIYYIGAHDLIAQILFLALLGAGVR